MLLRSQLPATLQKELKIERPSIPQRLIAWALRLLGIGVLAVIVLTPFFFKIGR